MADTTTRIQLSKKQRFEVFKRDSFTCQYCGRRPPEIVLEVDHIVAVVGGGTNADHNLLTACFDCNRGKSGRSLEVAPIDLEEKRRLIEERRAQVRAFEQALIEERDEIEAKVDAVISIYDYYFEDTPYFGFARTSIRNFLKTLPLTEVQEAMEMACERMQAGNVFRYFCGVCWRKIKGPPVDDETTP